MPRRADRESRRFQRGPLPPGRASPWPGRSQAGAGACRRTRPRGRGSLELRPPPSVPDVCSFRCPLPAGMGEDRSPGSWGEVGRGGESLLTDAEALHRGIAHLPQVGGAVGDLEHPLPQPLLVPFDGPRLSVIAQEWLVIAPPVALNR